MKSIKPISLLSSLMLSVAAFNAHAALYDRGNGMIYDSTQNITWLQDFNYALTSDYQDSSTRIHLCGHDGCSGWSGQLWQQGNDASNWAASLTVGGLSGWRLPLANLIGNTTPSADGSTDIGTNNIRSELGHLFYVDLGNVAGSNTLNTSFTDAASGTTKSFINVQQYYYWLEESGTTGKGWYFGTGNGTQNNDSPLDNSTFYAVAVHSGDIALPIPAAAWLFGSGLLGLASAARRKATAV